MAARRLIILMLILLGISTLLAAALPDRVRRAEDERTASEATTEAPETTATEAARPQGVKYLTFSADKPKIVVIPLEEGDQLSLTIESSAEDLVEILELGYLDAVGPHNPATFDVFADRPGDYGIKLTEAGRTIGRIEVSTAKAAKGAE